MESRQDAKNNFKAPELLRALHTKFPRPGWSPSRRLGPSVPQKEAENPVERGEKYCECAPETKAKDEKTNLRCKLRIGTEANLNCTPTALNQRESRFVPSKTPETRLLQASGTPTTPITGPSVPTTLHWHRNGAPKSPNK